MTYTLNIPTFAWSDISNWVEHKAAAGIYDIATSWPGLVVQGSKWGISLGMSSAGKLGKLLARVDDTATAALFGSGSKLSACDQAAALPIFLGAAEMGVRFFEKVPVTLLGGSRKREQFYEDEWITEKSHREKPSLVSRVQKTLMQIALGTAFTGIAALTYEGWRDKVISSGYERVADVGDVAVGAAALMRLGWSLKRVKDSWSGTDKFPKPIFDDDQLSVRNIRWG